MAFVCKLCGAKLEVEAQDEVVKCEYCGATTRVRETEPHQPAPGQPRILPVPPSFGQSQESLEELRPGLLPEVARASGGGTVAAAATAATATTKSKGFSGALVIIPIIAVAVGFAGWYLLKSKGRVDSDWYSPPCLVDGNGDGVLDIAGWSGSSSNQRVLTVVDGATGLRLWSDKKGWKSEDGVSCLARTHVAVIRPDFGVVVVAARDSSSRYSLQLGDAVQRIGQGEGCVVFETSDQKTTAVSVADGKPAECKAEKARSLSDGVGTDAPLHSFGEMPTGRIGDTIYSLSAKSPGTPFLIATAQQNGKELWSKQLEYTTAFVGDAGFAVTPDMIVLWGAPPGKDLYGVLIGLDPRTGAVRYDVKIDREWSGAIDAFVYNGRYVVTSWQWGLHAFDPKTGEEAWSMGGN